MNECPDFMRLLIHDSGLGNAHGEAPARGWSRREDKYEDEIMKMVMGIEIGLDSDSGLNLTELALSNLHQRHDGHSADNFTW